MFSFSTLTSILCWHTPHQRSPFSYSCSDLRQRRGCVGEEERSVMGKKSSVGSQCCMRELEMIVQGILRSLRVQMGQQASAWKHILSFLYCFSFHPLLSCGRSTFSARIEIDQLFWYSLAPVFMTKDKDLELINKLKNNTSSSIFLGNLLNIY